jgi:hypothetical protein
MIIKFGMKKVTLTTPNLKPVLGWASKKCSNKNSSTAALIYFLNDRFLLYLEKDSQKIEHVFWTLYVDYILKDRTGQAIMN